MAKEGVVLVLAVILLAFIFFQSNLASAGLLEWFGKITGKATQQNTNVSIAVAGTSAVTIEVFNSTLTSINPTTGSTTAVTFTVRVNDSDGFSDINTSSVTVNLTRSGEALRQNNTACSDLSQNTVTQKNFSCSVQMWYYDQTGAWTITAIANDLGNGTYVQNTTTTFNYGQLQDMNITPNQISFPSSAQGATNITANNWTLVYNQGNYNFTGINVTALNLYGETVTTVFINVANITVGNNTGLNSCDTSPTISANATALTNGTTTNVKYSILTRGNYSINNNQTGQETVFYCFRTIPVGIQSQTYSTTYTGGVWSVSVQL